MAEANSTGLTLREVTQRPVLDLMTGDLLALTPDDSVRRARQLIADSGLHAMPIVDRMGNAIGMVTSPDLEGRIDVDVLGNVMTTPVITVDALESVGTAARVMRSQYVHHLVVVEDGETVGIVSSFDLLHSLVESDGSVM